MMYGTILTFIKFNNFGTRHLNEPMHLFHAFCVTIQHIFEPLLVYEPSLNTVDKIYVLDLQILSISKYIT